MADAMDRFHRILKDYQEIGQPGDQQLLISLLGEVQEIFGYLPREIQEEIARGMGTTPALIAALIKRIPRLKGELCRHQITVCTGPRCSAKESAAILRKVRQIIGPLSNGVSDSHRFLLATRICMKRCPTAPNMIIDGTLYPHVKPEDIPAILEKYP